MKRFLRKKQVFGSKRVFEVNFWVKTGHLGHFWVKMRLFQVILGKFQDIFAEPPCIFHIF